jgi:hypothetical protein
MEQETNMVIINEQAAKIYNYEQILSMNLIL